MDVNISEVLSLVNQIGAVLLIGFMFLFVTVEPKKQPKPIVVGNINNQLYMTKPYAFQPYELHDYFVIEDEKLGVVVYAETESELKVKLKEELASLWAGMTQLNKESEVRNNFLHAVKQSQSEPTLDNFSIYESIVTSLTS